VGFAGANAARVIVLSIPDWSVTPFAAKDPRGPARISAEIDALNRVAREMVRTPAAFVDVTVDSRRAANDRSLLATDGLHPSAKMYASWARLTLPAARRALDA
jgi:lysophospholipase L1-like esterase